MRRTKRHSTTFMVSLLLVEAQLVFALPPPPKTAPAQLEPSQELDPLESLKIDRPSQTGCPWK